MVDEPDNVVLRMLREIRAKQDEHSAVLGQHSVALQTLGKDVEEVKFQVTYGLGVASINHLKAREIDHQIADLDTRVKRLEEKSETE